MYKKIVGIIIVMFLIGTALPTFGKIIEIDSIKINKFREKYEYDYLPGQLIVKFKRSPNSCVTVNTLNNKYQVSSMEKLFVNSDKTILDNIYILKVPENSDILSIVNDYSMNPNVEYAEPNGVAQPYTIPNDPDFDKQWYLENTGQTGGKIDADIDAPQAWNKIFGSKDIVIAIVDSGIDYTHPDLAYNIWINEDEIQGNDIDDDNNGFIDDIRGWDFAYKDNDPKDLHGHGTICTGVVGGVTDNNIGLAGVCWNSKIMIVQISNETWHGLFTNIASGIKYAADNGANVISMSFGWQGKSDNIVKNACEYAYNKGVILTASAGNSGNEEVINPAAFEHVIAVAGTNHEDSRMDINDKGIPIISNYGPWVDIAAPGQYIYSTMPTYDVYMNRKYGLNKNYTYGNGTSLSSPIVAGVAALILSKNPNLSPNEVKSRICEYSEPYRSIYDLGDGRINAYQAIEKTKVTSTYIPGYFIHKLIKEFPILEFLLLSS
jgi:subtilisin family serine protease